jgi:two-component system cell cycle response regulator CtrA
MRILLVPGYLAETYIQATALEAAGYIVDKVLDADAAFECLSVYEYDIVVLDGMPAKTDSCGIIRRMRSRRIDTPVLMVVAWGCAGIAVTALRAGADDVLTHPVTDEELVARIEAIIRRRNGHGQSTIRIGSLTVDMSSHDVIVGGRPMHLTNKEFGVLQVLALRRGLLVTTQSILNSLYNGLDDPQSRTIEVFICLLRKKMARFGADVTIETVRGAGYILRAQPPRQAWAAHATALPAAA